MVQEIDSGMLTNEHKDREPGVKWGLTPELLPLFITLYYLSQGLCNCSEDEEAEREKVSLEAASPWAMGSEMAVQSLAEQLGKAHKRVPKAYHVV